MGLATTHTQNNTYAYYNIRFGYGLNQKGKNTFSMHLEF